MKVSKSGFTIVELLIVIVVIAILAAISIVAYTGIQQRGRDSQRKSDLASIGKAIELYHADNGVYPMTGGWCTQISNPSRGSGFSAAFQAAIAEYMPRIPFDPLYAETYQDYFYIRNPSGQSYALFAELESSDENSHSVGTCTTKDNLDNDYDYRYPTS